MFFRTYKLCQIKKSVHIWKLFQHLNLKKITFNHLDWNNSTSKILCTWKNFMLLLIYKINTVANKIHSIKFLNYLNIMHECLYIYICIHIKHILFSKWILTITLENAFEANRGVYDVMNWLHKKLEKTLFTPLLTPLLIMHWILGINISK